MKNKHGQYKLLFAKIFFGVLPILLCLSFSSYAVQPEDRLVSATTRVQASNSFHNRLIIKYKSGENQTLRSPMSAASLNRISSVAGTELGYMRQLATGAHLLKLQQNLSALELNFVMAKLAEDPRVEYVEHDQLMQVMAVPNDPRYSEQWHYFEAEGGLNLPSAWDVTQGEGVVVAVVDTGYRPHADLAGNLLPGYDMISDTDISQDGDGRDADASDEGDWMPADSCGPGDPEKDEDSSWHGTHVAGTIAALTNNDLGVAGVAYKAKVVPVRALGRCGGSTSDITDAVIWAAGGNVSGVPANANPAQVINLSLGGISFGCGSTWQDAINIARNKGATVVAASGNWDINAFFATPANCNGVVTVSAVGRDGGKAFYSNYGSVVDVSAPGGDKSSSDVDGVLSTTNTGTTTPVDDSYDFYQGTSMAAPHVAGVAALLYAVKPGITPDQVETALKNSARAFPATCSQCGSGIVDAAAAVTAVSE